MAQPDENYMVKCPTCATINRLPVASEGKAGRCGACHGALPPLYVRPIALTERDFDSFIENYPGPVVAEFWAPW